MPRRRQAAAERKDLHMVNVKFTGIMPALVTPLDRGGNVNIPAIGELLDYNYGNGASGFYICGSTGEGPVLTAKARRDTAQAVMQANAGRGAVIVHVGAASPEEAFGLARHAREIGCDAVSSVVPNFFFRYSDDELVEYYKRLADAAQLPVLAYAQGLLGSSDVVELMSRLIKIDNVIGVKYTLTNFYDMMRIKRLNNGDINVINGPDEMLLCGLVMGADAGIGSTYNVMCGSYRELFDAFCSGELDTARELQKSINEVIEVIIRHGVIRTVKYMLSLKGIDAGVPAYPAFELSEDEKAAIRRELGNTFYK